jgi:proteasome assembly chaperone 3
MAIPTLSANLESIAINSDGVESSPFPAATKQAAGVVNGVPTDVSSVYFADKILFTISQGGRLSQWVQITQILILNVES